MCSLIQGRVEGHLFNVMEPTGNLQPRCLAVELLAWLGWNPVIHDSFRGRE